MKQRTILLSLLCLCLSIYVQAQISVGGTPKSFQLGLDDNNVQRIVLPTIDVKALEKEDESRAADNMPYRFAFGFPVSYNLNNIGTWTGLPNGDRIWRLRINCQQALSVNFLYDDFFIPQGGLFYIYAADRSEIIGGFGAHNNRASRKFATGMVNSTNVVLEYYEPAAVNGQGSISVNQVSHAYRGFQDENGQSEGLGDAGACQVNVNCSPEGDNWQTEKKSVARIIINGIETCTGTLINNVAENCTPYFLTANHCIDGSYDAVTQPDLSGAVFYWNYERSGCANSGSVPNETTAGATVIANPNPSADANASDFALFELTEDPSDVYDVYVAGFDASGTPGTGGVGIHHPGLDAKKIATHSTTPPIVVNNNYWRIYWDATLNGHSVTEGGSSGSGLFNSQGRLIGQLFGGFLGGQPNCSDPADDEGDYGRLSVSWDNQGATDARRRLRDWLDPNNTGTRVVGGRSCMIPDYVLAADPSSSTNCGGNTAAYTIDVESRNGYVDPVTLSVSGLPAGATAGFGTNPVTPGNSTVLTISGISGVADGSYNFNLNGSSTSGNKLLVLTLDVADQSTAMLLSPADAATDVGTFPTLSWVAAVGAGSYDVQVATDAAFTNIVASDNVPTNSWTVSPVLDILTPYFWRVRHVRTCGNDPWASPFSFTTGDANLGTCGKPIQLVCGGTFSGNNANGENNFEQHDPGGANSWTGPELIFEFEAAAGNVQAQITGLTADLDFYLFTDCGDPVNSELDESESTASTETVSATVTAGTYYLMVDGFQGATSNFNLTLTCTPPTGCDPLSTPTLLSPSNGATDISTTPMLSWTAEPMADSYDVQVATDAGFSSVVASSNVTMASWTVSPALLQNTTYFWRVRYVQTCGNDPWSGAFSFTTAAPTGGMDCGTVVSTDVPVAIPDQTIITSTITIPASGTITDINVLFRGEHDAVRDLIFELISPTGTTIQLVDLDDPCNRQDDFDIGFDDQSTLTIATDIPCPPTDGRFYQPEQALSLFNGEEVNGVWTLRVTDDRNNFTGQLNYWEIQYCIGTTGEECEEDIEVNDDPIDSDTYNASNTITSTGTVEMDSVVIFEAGMTITLSPDFVAENGSTFTARIQECVPASAKEDQIEERSEEIMVTENSIKVFPNPFSDQTTIAINLMEESEVAIELYDLTGKRIHRIHQTISAVGTHQHQIDASNLESGIYILMVRIGDDIQTKKLSVVK